MAFKILSLDGGGSWAMIQARVLLDMHGDIRGHAVLRQFDLAIANSGGSLVLAALCNDMLLSEIIGVFENEGQRQQVFSALTFKEKLQNPASFLQKPFGMGPKYDTVQKLAGLTRVLADADHHYQEDKTRQPVVGMFLDEIPAMIGKNYQSKDLQLVIVGFDYFRRRVNFFRSSQKSTSNRFSPEFFRVRLGHAIHASSNAPVNYFDDPATVILTSSSSNDTRSSWFWDGAVSGFNNPVLAGLTEAITNGVPAADCRILSIGTGTGQRAIITDYGTSSNTGLQEIYQANLDNPLVITDYNFSFLRDVDEMATSILADPPDSDTFIAYAMVRPSLDNKGAIVRINPCLSPVLNPETKLYECPACYNGDDAARANFRALLDLDMDAVLQEQVALIRELCDKFLDCRPGMPRVANQLIRGDLTTGHIGQPDYCAAKDRWRDIERMK